MVLQPRPLCLVDSAASFLVELVNPFTHEIPLGKYLIMNADDLNSLPRRSQLPVIGTCPQLRRKRIEPRNSTDFRAAANWRGSMIHRRVQFHLPRPFVLRSATRPNGARSTDGMLTRLVKLNTGLDLPRPHQQVSLAHLSLCCSRQADACTFVVSPCPALVAWRNDGNRDRGLVLSRAPDPSKVPVSCSAA